MFANKYRKRLVSDSSKKGCFVCHKPSNTVLVNEVASSDFFYVCASHLTDKGFAKEVAQPAGSLPPKLPPKPSETEKEDLSKEIEALKKDWDKVKGKDEGAKPPAEAKELPKAPSPTPSPPAGPVYYELNAHIFKLRIDARKRLVQDKKTRQVLATQAFPSVPNHTPMDAKPPSA